MRYGQGIRGGVNFPESTHVPRLCDLVSIECVRELTTSASWKTDVKVSTDRLGAHRVNRRYGNGKTTENSENDA
jgi:hypothetical protein